MKQKLTEMKGKTDKSVVTGDFKPLCCYLIVQAGNKSVRIFLTCSALSVSLSELTFIEYPVQQQQSIQSSEVHMKYSAR